MVFSVYPVLLVNDQPIVYGLRSVFTYLFANTKLLPTKDLAKIETLFALADNLYSSICPIIAFNQSCVIKNELLQHARSTLKEVLETIPKYFTCNNTIGDLYANVNIAIAPAAGIDVSPLKPQKFDFPKPQRGNYPLPQAKTERPCRILRVFRVIIRTKN